MMQLLNNPQELRYICSNGDMLWIKLHLHNETVESTSKEEICAGCNLAKQCEPKELMA